MKAFHRLAALALALGACSVQDLTFTYDAPNDGQDIDVPIDAREPITLVVTPMDLMIPETQTRTFTVALSGPPIGTLPVSLSSSDGNKVGVTPAQLSFTASDWMTAKTVTVSGRDDADTVDESETVTVASGDTPTVIVTVSVDDDDGLGIIATPSPMTGLGVTEGATAPLQVRLSAQPTGTTVVTVMSADTTAATVAPMSLTFTQLNWFVDQSVVVTGVGDADTTDETTMVSLAGTGLMAVDVPITVTDDDVLGIFPSTTNLGTLPEGGGSSFGVTLTQQPAANITVTVASSDATVLGVTPTNLTFTPANWNVAQNITVSAGEDLDVANESVSISLSSAGPPVLATRTVTATITDNDVQTIVASPIPLPVDEGGSRDLNVHLAYQPSADVTLTVTSLNLAVATVTPATLTFTPANYDTNQTVTASAPEDTDASPGMTAIRLESQADGLLTDIPVAVTDNDQLTIQTSTTAVTLSESGTMMFGVRLTAMPVAGIVVNVNSGDPSAVSVSPSALSFSTANWNNFQMVTLSGVQDLDLANEAVTITLAASGLPAQTVDATITDDDMQTVLVSAATVSVNQGGTGTVGVSLRYAPAANVSVSVVSADTSAATVAPASLTFTPQNFATPQNVTITGVVDADTLDDNTMVTASATGATSGVVAVTVNDTDALGIGTSVTTLTVAEGGTGVVGVSLTAQPAADTTVSVASSDTGAATVSQAALTFTTANWNTVQNLTVTGVQDPDGINENVTLTFTSPGPPVLTPRTVTVTVTDDDPQDIVLSAANITVAEGGMGTFSVHLAAQPTSDVVVMINSADITAASASPGALTFTPANYATNQSVTVAGLEDIDLSNESVAITASSSGLTTKTVAATITDNDSQIVIASPTTLTIPEGTSGSFGVALTYQPAADVVVTLTPMNGAIASTTPGTLTFTPANYATAQNVVVTGVEDDDAVTSATMIAATAPSAMPASVSVTVPDNDTLALATTVSAITVVEGTPGTFGVHLTAQPAADTMVTVASSDNTAATVSPLVMTFTTANWNVDQLVTVAGTGDPDAVNESAILTVASAGLPSITVNASVTDDETQAIVTSAPSVALGEAGTATFGVHLAAQPPADVTVTVASADTGAATVAPATLTFTPANYAANQTVTVTGVADPDLADESVTITMTSSGLANQTVTAGVTDDDTQIVQMSTGTLNLTEGTSGTVGVRLGFMPAANVTVTVTSVSTGVATVSPASLTFTPANYNTNQTVTVTAPQDVDLAPGSTSVTATAPSATTGTTTVNVTDDDTQVVQVSAGTVSLTEGGTTTFGVTLGFAPSADVTVTVSSGNTAVATVAPTTLTFTPANYNNSQSVTVSAPQDIDLANNSATITAAATGATPGTVTANVTDNDTQVVQVAPGTIAVTEGATNTFGVSLAFAPAANVTVTVSSGNNAVATTSTSSLTFTPANYATPQNITVTATQDADLVNGSTTVTASAPSATAGVVTVNVTDDDSQIVQLSAGTLSLTEGGTTTVGVTLGFVPGANVTVTVASANTAVATVSPTTLTFTPANYNQSQTVTLTAPQDIDVAPGTTTIDASATGATPATATVNVTDNDTQIVQLSPTTVSTTEGSTAGFGVTLGFQPSANVTVTLTSGNSAVATVSPATMTFTPANYNVSQNATVTAVQDVDLVAGSTTITGTAPSATPGSVTINVTDDDTQVVMMSTGTLSVTEGGSATVGVSLGFVPTSNVTVTLTSGNSAVATVAQATLTFTPANYATNQTITINATQDADLAPGSTSVTASASGATSGVTTVNVTDDDTQIVLLSSPTISLTEGNSTTIGVTLGFVPAANVTVTVASADTAVATVSPTTLTFTPANYNMSQSVTVSAPQDANLAAGSTTITGSAPSATSSNAAVNVTDDDTQIVQFSPGTVSVTEGGTTNFGVTLGFVPSSNVTVTVTTGNALVATVSPATITFTPANYNVSQTVTVTAPHDIDLAAGTTTITGTASGATSGSTTVNVTDDDTQIVQLSTTTLPLTEGNNGTVGVSLGFQPAANVSVTLTSAATTVATVAPATLTFTPANYATAQNITITAVQDTDLVGQSTTVTASAPSATSGVVTTNVTDDDTQIVVLSSGTIGVTEGATNTVGVTLGFVPSGNVTVTVGSANTAVATVAPTSLSFTPGNYNVSQTVTITAPQDGDLAAGTTTVTASAPSATSGTATVNVTDDDTQVVQVGPGTVSPTEGGTTSFGVTLGFQPSANVTVMVLSNNVAVATVSPGSLTFTPANYNVSQNVTVTAVQDPDLVGGSTTITASAPSATSGTVTVNVTDDDTQVVLLSTGTLSVTEGNTGTVGVTLGFVPSGSVTVNVASGNTALATVSPASLTFNAGNYSVAQTVTVSGVQDADTANGSTSLTASATGATSGSATIDVTDDDVQRVVVSPSALSLTEGGGGSFGVTLAQLPAGNVTVNVSSGNAAVATVSPTTLTFTPANYNISQTVNVTAVEDANLVSNSTTITASSAGITSGTVVVDVADNDTQVVLASPTTVGITEGGSTTFGVTLGFQPSADTTVTVSSGNTAVATVSPATLTFTPANYNVAQNVTVTAPQDLDLVANSTSISASTPGATSATVTTNVTDDDTQIVSMSAGTLTVTEGSSGTRGVTLGFIPTANVTVTLGTSNSAVATVSPATLTFTPANYNVSQTITITAPQDSDLVNGSATITGSAPSATSGTVAVTVTDDDTQIVQVSTGNLAVTEGSTNTFGVTLGFVPSANVTVTLTSGNTAIATAAPATLTFTPANYNVSQNVTVTGTQDADLVASSTTITASAPSATSGVVNANVTDDDTQVVQAAPGTVALTEGNNGTVGVTLGFIPTANTTVTVTSNNTAVATASPATLTFTPANYNVSQIVTVTAVQDIDLVANSTTISFAATGATSATTTVNTTDDDTQIVVMSQNSINVSEGQSGTRTVTLGFVPTANVTVTLSTSNAAVATVGPATLTFTPANYNVGQTITITAPQDLDLVGNAATITGSAPSSTSGTVSVTTNDDDFQVVQASTASVTVTEGGSGTYGVTLGFIPSANVTVTLSSAATGVATVAPSTLTFTPANYNVSQTVTVSGTQDLDLVQNSTTITASAPSATSSTISAIVNDDDTQIVQFSTAGVTIAEGGTTTVGVTLGFIPTGNVTVTGSSGNTAVATGSPTTLTFTPANYNVAQNVTITAVQDLDLVANSTTITASAPGATSGSLNVTSTDDDTQTVLVGVANMNITEGETKNRQFSLAYIPTGNVTVTISSDNPSILSVNAPTTLTFTPADYNVGQAVSFFSPHDADLVGGTTRIYGTAPGANSATVDVTVTDDDVQTVLMRESLVSALEGTTTDINVNLGFIPTANTTVTVTSGNTQIATVSPVTLTFTPANYNTYQTVTVTGTQDINLANEATTVTATTSNPGDVAGTTSVNIVDDDTQIVQVSPATGSLSITEGATGTFSVNLAFQPSANVTVTVSSGSTAVATVSPSTLTFTPANYATNQTVTVTASQDADLVTNTTTITCSTTGATSGTKSVNNLDNDTQIVQVSPTALNLTEGGNSTFGVTLGFIPTANVTVNLSSANGAVATISPASLTFTPANYNTSQTVTVSAPHDIDLAAGSTTISATATGATSGTVNISVSDDDTQTVFFNYISINQTEGYVTTATQVRLDYQPSANVIVTLSSSNTAVATVSPTTLTFTPANYNVYQSFTTTLVQDVNVVTDTATITGSAPGAISDTFSITSNDNDTQDIVLTESLTSIGEASSGTFQVRLAFQPVANTVITCTSADTTALNVTTGGLTFTPANYSTNQNVTIAGVADTDTVNEAITITCSSAPLPNKTFIVSQYDNDLLYDPPNPSTLNCGVSSNIAMNLVNAPLGDIVVTATVTGGTAGDAVVSPTTRTFTTATWSSTQYFTVTRGDFAGTNIVTFSAPGQTSRTATVSASGIDCL